MRPPVRGTGAGETSGAGAVPGAPGGAIWPAPKLHRGCGAGGKDALHRAGRQAGGGARDDAIGDAGGGGRGRRLLKRPDSAGHGISLSFAHSTVIKHQSMLGHQH